MGLTTKLKNAWNAFTNKDPTQNLYYNSDIINNVSYANKPDRIKVKPGNEKSIVTSIINRFSLDAASVEIEHCKLDSNDRYIYSINSGLNNCLSLEANIDQTYRQFLQDAYFSMLQEGCVAIVPVDTDISPIDNNSIDILTLRVGKIIEWYPKHVKINLYDDNDGQYKDIIMPKASVAILENPFYAVMNEHNSTMQRINRKLALLDSVDEQASSEKLNMIIQLPYALNNQLKMDRAEERRKSIEMQLHDSKYGIAYIDSTEKITQLTRPIENNLLKQIEYLTEQFFSQLGITSEILNGTAPESVMVNYNNRVIEPIVSSLVTELKRKFLTKTARTQKHSIIYFIDPFKLTPVNQLAEIADKFTRNEILSTNEVRQLIGKAPVNDERADELRNKNMPMTPDMTYANTNQNEGYVEETELIDQDKVLEDIDSEIDNLTNMLEHSELMHKSYASKYYDPVKAHEYYEEHKQLKGYNKPKLNEEGQAMASYVSKQIYGERDKNIETHKENREREREKAANDRQLKNEEDKKLMNENIEKHAADMKNEIQSIREEIDNMTKNERFLNHNIIANKIENLKKKQADYVNSQYKDYSNKIESNTNTYITKKYDINKSYNDKIEKEKKDADSKYAKELSKIRSDSKYLKTNTSKSSNSTKTVSKKETESKKDDWAEALKKFKTKANLK